jgi:hypothetical protein
MQSKSQNKSLYLSYLMPKFNLPGPQTALFTSENMAAWVPLIVPNHVLLFAF